MLLTIVALRKILQLCLHCIIFSLSHSSVHYVWALWLHPSYDQGGLSMHAWIEPSLLPPGLGPSCTYYIHIYTYIRTALLGEPWRCITGLSADRLFLQHAIQTQYWYATCFTLVNTTIHNLNYPSVNRSFQQEMNLNRNTPQSIYSLAKGKFVEWSFHK